MSQEQQERQGDANIFFDNRAQEAIEMLNVGEFIETHGQAIAQRLEQNFLHYRNEEDAALLFIADSLPLAAALAQVGSPLQDFRRASDWVHNELATTNAGSFLSVLTLLHIIHRGYAAALQSGDQGAQELWDEMSQKVHAAIDAC